MLMRIGRKGGEIGDIRSKRQKKIRKSTFM